MPEEILAIVIVSIVFGSVITIIKTVLGYRERTKGVRPGVSGGGTSLTTSEFEGMMRRVVREATLPLADRLEALEGRLADRPKRLEPARRERLDLDLDEPEFEEEPVRSRSRTRQR